ncbi:uncharacterized protein B0H64DRAFT_151743 [Chaetomium fimeti]|uniref:Uncharacterized protein n=1 Tax=Chaetomium fimeti TaxID=1854472 RepID=A0AAE0LSC1_9PEZI|nr:hypothetical protein B0H64DRAFT_151743 [Chaetomium fimeti]
MSSPLSSPSSPNPTTPFSPTSTSTTLPSSYATLSLHKSDTLRFLNFPATLTTALEPAILAAWPPGIDSSSPAGGGGATSPGPGPAVEYKCKGRPFGYYGTQQHVGGIRLVRDVLAVLYRHGWELVTSVLCSRRYTAKDTLFFRCRAQAGRPTGAGAGAGALPAVEWLALAPMGTDKLRVVYDAEGVKLHGAVGEEDNHHDHDHDHLGVLVSGVKKTLQEMGCFEKGDWSHDSFEFELKGKPWRSRGEASNTVRIMLMRLLELMEGHKWRLYAAFVQRTGSDEDRILDTWYFVREKGEKGNKGQAVEMEAPVKAELL